MTPKVFSPRYNESYVNLRKKDNFEDENKFEQTYIKKNKALVQVSKCQHLRTRIIETTLRKKV